MENPDINKFFSRESSPVETEDLSKWLDEDPANRAQFEKEYEFFMASQAVLTKSNSVKIKRGSRSRRISRMTSYVAGGFGFAAILVCVFFLTRTSTIDTISTRSELISVPYGKNMQLTLEDGSTIWLNSGTEVEYPVIFGRKSREFKIKKGEVLFDISKDEKRPFIVKTYAADVKVLGTRFDVKVNEEKGLFSTALLRGSVSANSTLNDEEFLLKPNEILSLKDGKFTLSYFSSASPIECWKDGIINAGGIGFEELMDIFEKAFDIEIEIVRPDIPEIRLTSGKIRVSDGVENALKAIQLASDFSYTRDFNTNKIIIH